MRFSEFPTTHSFHTIFFTRWKPPARPRRGPAGSPSICSPRPPDGTILGAVPCYLKSHSRGEYVFDRGWAEAYERAGGELLPEAPGLGAVHAGDRPAAAGRARRPSADSVRDGLIAGLIELCRKREASSVHFTFLPEAGMPGAGRRTASCSAPTSSSTGRTTATPPSTISSRRSRRASARPSGASGATRWRPASPCTGSPARI